MSKRIDRTVLRRPVAGLPGTCASQAHVAEGLRNKPSVAAGSKSLGDGTFDAGALGAAEPHKLGPMGAIPMSATRVQP